MTTALIGIVTWNSAGVIEPCLESIAAAAEGLDYRIVVFDNASSDRSAAIAASYPKVQVIESPENVGYSRGMNQALTDADARVDALIALNPDTVCSPGSLARLCGALMSEPGLGLVVPALQYSDGSPQPSVYRFPSISVTAAASFLPLAAQRGRVGRRFGLEAAPPSPAPIDIDWAIGAVHVIRPATRSGQPVYNERWFMYAEDLDLCWALENGGWRRRIYPEVVVTHLGNVSGRRAWGPRRTERWLSSTYDWYGLRRGGGAARRWAAINTLGASWRLAQKRVRQALGRPIAPWEEHLAEALRIHWGYLRRGSLMPPGPPRG